MKRILATGSIAVIAMVGFAGSASAAPPADAACFGGVHKTINTEGFAGFNNVGEVVKALGGQGKNETARGICAG
jgi:hypothetical protein